MVTCDEIRKTGHEWVLYSRCENDHIHVVPDGCSDCEPATKENTDG